MFELQNLCVLTRHCFPRSVFSVGWYKFNSDVDLVAYKRIKIKIMIKMIREALPALNAERHFNANSIYY